MLFPLLPCCAIWAFSIAAEFPHIHMCAYPVVIFAEGRTFPVERLYLEDVYQLLQYKLEPDSPCAVRGGSAQRASAAALAKNAAGGSKCVVGCYCTHIHIQQRTHRYTNTFLSAQCDPRHK